MEALYSALLIQLVLEHGTGAKLAAPKNMTCELIGEYGNPCESTFPCIGNQGKTL